MGKPLKLLGYLLTLIVLTGYIGLNVLMFVKVPSEFWRLAYLKIIITSVYQYGILMALVIIMAAIMSLLIIDFSWFGRSVTTLFLIVGIFSIGSNIYYIARIYGENLELKGAVVNRSQMELFATSPNSKYSKIILDKANSNMSIELYIPEQSKQKIFIYLPSKGIEMANQQIEFEQLQKTLINNGVVFARIKEDTLGKANLETEMTKIVKAVGEIDLYFQEKFDIYVGGSGMSAYLLQKTVEEKTLNIEGVMLLYPVTDMAKYSLHLESDQNLIGLLLKTKYWGSGSFINTDVDLEKLAGIFLSSNMSKGIQTKESANLYTKVNPSNPAIAYLIITGSQDSFTEINEVKKYKNWLEEQSAKVYFFQVPFTEHYFDLFSDLKSYATQKTYEQIIYWIQEN